MGCEGRLGRHLPYSGLSRRTTSAGPDRQFGGEGASLRIRRQRGEQNQAIGRSRGGRTTKIHALTDGACRPIAFMLTGGQVADCTAGELLLEQMPKHPSFMATRAMTAMRSAIRSKVKARCRTSRQRPTALEKLLLAAPLSQPQRHRAHVRSPQGLPSHRNTLRPAGRQLPRRRLPRRNRQLLVIS